MLNCAPTKRTPVLVLLTGHYKEVEVHIQARTEVIVPVTSEDSDKDDSNNGDDIIEGKLNNLDKCNNLQLDFSLTENSSGFSLFPNPIAKLV